MSLVHKNRVKETSTTTGTGTYSLAGAFAADYQKFVTGVGTGNTCFYCAFEAGVGWEVGIGTVTSGSPDTLARTSIIESSNSNAAVNWGAGTRTLFLTLPATKFGHLADYQEFNASGTWTKATDAGANSLVIVRKFAPGGGGARAGSGSAGGGGGGMGIFEIYLASDLSATETVTIGAAGVGRITSTGDGTSGGSVTFGSHGQTAFGGGGGKGSIGNNLSNIGGGAGVNGDAVGPIGTFLQYLAAPYFSDTSVQSLGGAAVPATATPAGSPSPNLMQVCYGANGAGWMNFHEVGCCGTIDVTTAYAAGNGIQGGGGGGANATNTAGGTSKYAGAGGTGGATPTAGTAPSGGGGAGLNVNGKDGGAGKVQVWLLAA